LDDFWSNLAKFSIFAKLEKTVFVSTLASQVPACFEFFCRLRLGHSSNCMADSIPELEFLNKLWGLGTE
jgi:hypothetical protein